MNRAREQARKQEDELYQAIVKANQHLQRLAALRKRAPAEPAESPTEAENPQDEESHQDSPSSPLESPHGAHTDSEESESEDEPAG